MVVAITYLLMGLVFGWAAVANGPTRFRRWTDLEGRRRHGGALNWPATICFFVVGIVKLLHQI